MFALIQLNKYPSADVLRSVGRGSQGAWQKFERGELLIYEFYEAFGRDLSDAENGNKWYVILGFATSSIA